MMLKGLLTGKEVWALKLLVQDNCVYYVLPLCRRLRTGDFHCELLLIALPLDLKDGAQIATSILLDHFVFLRRATL